MNNTPKIIGFQNGKVVVSLSGQKVEIPLQELQDFLQKNGQVSAQIAEQIFNINEIGTANFNFQVQQLPPDKYLTSMPFRSNVFLGREETLEELKNQLFDFEQDNLLILINGQGGIGKTSLASQYYHRYQDEYQHLAWLLAEPNILDAILRLKNPLNIDFPPEMPNEERLEILLQKMANLDKPCLLVLDNANQIEELENHYVTLRKCSNFHILLTSRINEFEDAETYKIKALPKPTALELFQRHYPKHHSEENTLFENIYDAIEGNTLVIEVLSKNLHQINKHEAFYPLSAMVKDIQEKGLLQLSDQEKVRTDWRFQKAKPEQIIEAIYDLRPLSDEELYLLSNFAVLPPENVSYEMLKDLLTPENFRQFSNNLDQLYQKGWIEKIEVKQEDFYKISPVIQEIVRIQNKYRLAQDCQIFIEKLDFLFEIDSSYNLVNISHQQASKYYPYAQAVFFNIPSLSLNLGALGIHLGDYENNIGNLQQAREYFLKAKDILSTVDDYSTSLSRLGESYEKTGELEIALKFHQESKDIMLNLHKNEPENIECTNQLAINYSKLGKVHNSLGNIDKALEYFKQYNHIKKKLHNDYPTDNRFINGLAISYQYLGYTYFNLGVLSKALEAFKEDYQLQKKMYEANPNNVGFKNGLAISYQWLGRVYSELGNVDDTLKNFKKFNQLEKELHKHNSEDVRYIDNLAISYQCLGYTYFNMKVFDESFEAFEAYYHLQKYLCEFFPNNIEFQKGLALAYQWLGMTQSQIGNLEKVLEYYKKFHQLEKELYSQCPNDTYIKSSLAFSYVKIHDIYLERHNHNEAKKYLQDGLKIYEELKNDFPTHPQFQKAWAVVQKELLKFDI